MTDQERADLHAALDQMWATDFDLNEWATVCHFSSRVGGWWNDKSEVPEELLAATKIALIHSEVSECLEGIRKGLPDDKLPHRKMEEVEAADILIRLFDLAGRRRWDLVAAVREKMMYNQTRADHTAAVRSAEGGKKF